MDPLNYVLGLLSRYKYFAMFGILLLCGTGVPLPEELTLIASGLAVGWREADFWLASLACLAGILGGDTLIFFLGKYWGRQFLAWRPIRRILTRRRQIRVQKLFAKHGNKAVFFARFFVGVRIGVYAYAGQHGMKWSRFFLLDLLGGLLSAPTSIWVGKFAAERIADPEEARDFAQRLIHQGGVWLYAGIGVLVLAGVLHWLWARRNRKKADALPAASGVTPAQGEAVFVNAPCGTSDPAAPQDAGPRPSFQGERRESVASSPGLP